MQTAVYLHLPHGNHTPQLDRIAASIAYSHGLSQPYLNFVRDIYPIDMLTGLGIGRYLSLEDKTKV